MIIRLKKIASASVVRRNIAMTLGRQILAAFAQLLLVVLIARELGPEGNGYYAMAILVPTMLTNFLNLGVGPATVYYVSRGEFNIHQAISENLQLAFMIATIGIIGALPALYFFGGYLFPNVPNTLLYIGLISFPLSLLLAYLKSILQGIEDFGAFNLTVLVPPYINLIGVAVVIYGFDLGIFGAMFAYVIGQASGLLIVGILLVKKKHTKSNDPKTVAVRDYKKRTLNYGWKAHLSNILAFINYRSDIFLVNFFMNPAVTGIYVIAVQIAEKLWMLSQAASAVLLPRLSAMHHDPQARSSLTNKGFIIVSVITAVGSIIAAILLWWLVGPVFGNDYSAALPAFLYLLPGIIAGAGSRIYSNCIAAAGKPEWNMYISLAVVTINIVGNILLIPELDIIGAALATSIAYCANAAIKRMLIKKYL
ncbi:MULTISPECIES: flippase [unclassified Salinivibrio]|uniref:flippase n=1 Tax=unclassified Salinivibrio TaxID=2636825 RepID=UPI00128D12BC|nr:MULTISPECIES: flippase [unclassified Salinivibrio]MPX90681.1 flippase [Salinivibrio sp. VYel1]MPX96026.1 flippase [Salinivibrio sp. VYel6]MPY03267.1 flippase [Salinivibrio sp. VYel5]MPY06247.1 flippase [Salinivibrio sp. VYel8]MPY15212.1 flippase [Salinivibrio sp. VGrn1]